MVDLKGRNRKDLQARGLVDEYDNVDKNRLKRECIANFRILKERYKKGTPHHN